MLRSLRGRLLLSYLAVIGAALLVIAAALFGFATVSGVRLIPSLQRLAAISRTNQNELLQLWELGGSSAELQALLINTAEQTDTRILVVDSGAQQIILDTATGDDWVGDEFSQVEQLPGDELLELARLESGQMELAREPVDLAQLLEIVRRSFEPRAQARNINLRLQVQPAPPVLGDPDRLVQVYSNLVDNALTYTPDGGHVVMTVQPSANGVATTVRDNGSGIAAEDQERVFERFFRGERSRARSADRGSGLGLAIARELVAAHGGEITLGSTPGVGTEFSVWLPAMGAPGTPG